MGEQGPNARGDKNTPCRKSRLGNTAKRAGRRTFNNDVSATSKICGSNHFGRVSEPRDSLVSPVEIACCDGPQGKSGNAAVKTPRHGHAYRAEAGNTDPHRQRIVCHIDTSPITAFPR